MIRLAAAADIEALAALRFELWPDEPLDVGRHGYDHDSNAGSCPGRWTVWARSAGSSTG